MTSSGKNKSRYRGGKKGSSSSSSSSARPSRPQPAATDTATASASSTTAPTALPPTVSAPMRRPPNVQPATRTAATRTPSAVTAPVMSDRDPRYRAMEAEARRQMQEWKEELGGAGAFSPLFFMPREFLVKKPELSNIKRVENSSQGRLAKTFACMFVGAARDVDGWDVAGPPPQGLADHINREYVHPRCEAMFKAHGQIVATLSIQERDALMASSVVHASFLCAQEFYGKLDLWLAERNAAFLTMRVKESFKEAKPADLIWFIKFVQAWLDENRLKVQAEVKPQEVRVDEVQGVKVGDRLHDLQLHFAKGNPWPRLYHGTRVMPFGVSDLLNELEFDAGVTSKSCVTCDEVFTEAFKWREHLLATTEHEVYLCCKQQFVDLKSVLKHLVDNHGGQLGALDPFVMRSNPFIKDM